MSVVWKTRLIETHLTEKQFLNRLKTLCREKTRFSKGYHDEDVFVIKRNKNKFWLCKHYAHVGRTDGYANDCICFKYIVKENGYIDIEYRFGKLLLFVIPFIICFTAGIALLVAAGILAGCSANKSLDRSSDDKNAGTKHEEPATSEDPKTTVTTTTGTTETSETSDPSDKSFSHHKGSCPPPGSPARRIPARPRAYAPG